MKTAVLIPCYNEALTIEKVVKDFRRELPDATIYVYDNNSTDDTASIAEIAGAVVRRESRQGKGFVVRQMFMDVEADYYIMVDGDDTYPAESVHQLLTPLINQTADMTIGDRLSNGTYAEENKRQFHGFGNNLVKNSINLLFHSHIQDVMTGYRGFNRVFVKSLPVISNGFQIETEFTIHALDKRFKVVEIPIDYRDRPEGSFSKLNTMSDGLKVIATIIRMVKDSRPRMFFGILSA
ncbi:MAG: glycosyltransferase family 2 protein, partial [Lactobacillus sp.]|nr:glycosyltransferase family 2 protein [Lactobacillus sp.]